MNKHQVSVIIPIYNTAAYLPACIESVLQQSYKNLELFLVDDGSTDSSLEICQRYAEKDSRIRILTKENGGQGSARNLALDRIEGEYISFVDSDDAIDCNMLENMVGALEHYDADLAVCGIRTQNKNGLVGEDARPPLAVYENQELMKAYASTPYIHTGPCNKVYRSCLFQEKRFPEIRTNEDAYIMHEILGQCRKAVLLPEHYYIQNIRAGSTEQRKFTEHNLVLLECAQRLIAYYAQNYPDLVEYVAYKEVNDTAALMCRILTGCAYWKHRKLYKRLEAQLQYEFRKLADCYPEPKNITTLTVGALHNPLRFKLEFFCRGILKRMRG